ncbi:hypothetical protein QJ527_12540 [Enterococcus mundtii]|nr:hypothetical protein [Enterococcus mundtii]MDK4212359.1 hypothetical protein [Enterococcus mundtii]MDO7880255.1 hypothetical protein [Enterococcus mundtii]
MLGLVGIMLTISKKDKK